MRSHDGPMAHSGHGLVHCTCLLLGVKRTSPGALQMSAFDPKRTSSPSSFLVYVDIMPSIALGVESETARVHHACRRGGGMASVRACAAAGDAGYWLP